MAIKPESLRRANLYAEGPLSSSRTTRTKIAFIRGKRNKIHSQFALNLTWPKRDYLDAVFALWQVMLLLASDLAGKATHA